MKKAKIMLTAIVIFAAVGGALAFKAKRNFTVYCKDSSLYCTVPKVNYTTTTTGILTQCTTIPINTLTTCPTYTTTRL